MGDLFFAIKTQTINPQEVNKPKPVEHAGNDEEGTAHHARAD